MSVRGRLRRNHWEQALDGSAAVLVVAPLPIEQITDDEIQLELREVRDEDQPTREELVGGLEMAESELAAICAEAPHLGFTTLNRLHNLLGRERGEAVEKCRCRVCRERERVERRTRTDVRKSRRC